MLPAASTRAPAAEFAHRPYRFAPVEPACYERVMRTAALVLALAGAAAMGFAGLFMIGSALAEARRVEQAQALRPHLVTDNVLRGATRKRNAAAPPLGRCRS